MIRLLLALLIVAISLTMLSRMLSKPVDGSAPKPEDTIIGAAMDPYNKAQNFSEEYDKMLDEQREDLDKKIDQ